MIKKDNSDTALYTVWFGLNYGSILASVALYKAVEKYGLHPVLLQKQPELWTKHYADKSNIAGSFIYQHCNVLEIFDNEEDMSCLKKINNHIVGSDVVWNYDVIGKQSGMFYFLEDVAAEQRKIAYGSCFGGKFTPESEFRNNYGRLLKRFNGISVKEREEGELLENLFNVSSEMVLDPVFLCDKEFYFNCAENSAAKKNEKADSFVFSYIECCDKRKRQFLLRGNDIFLRNNSSLLRNFIDINRYAESKALLDLDVAYHILVEDWLYYLINSEFVITDNYYGMLFALIFEKNFVVLANKDFPDLYRYKAVLRPLGLEERLVILQEDLKKKEYLFRKPIKYDYVNKKLDSMRLESEQWLKAQLDIKEEGKGDVQ